MNISEMQEKIETAERTIQQEVQKLIDTCDFSDMNIHLEKITEYKMGKKPRVSAISVEIKIVL